MVCKQSPPWPHEYMWNIKEKWLMDKRVWITNIVSIGLTFAELCGKHEWKDPIQRSYIKVVSPMRFHGQFELRLMLDWDHHNSTSSMRALWIPDLSSEPRHRLTKHLDAFPPFTVWLMVDAQGKSVTRCFACSFILFAFPKMGEERRNLGKVAPRPWRPLNMSSRRAETVTEAPPHCGWEINIFTR